MAARETNSFLMGNAPSSGSTLLHSLIGCHQEVYQPPELNIFDKPDWVMERNVSLRKIWRRTSLSGYNIHFPCEHAKAFRGFDEIPVYPKDCRSYLDFGLEVMIDLARKSGKNCFVEKTPNNIFSMPTIYRKNKEVNFIVIVRNPVAVFNSLVRRGHSPFAAVARWYFPNLVVRWLRKMPRVKVIWYEDLVENPRQVLESTLNFMGKVGEGVDLQNRSATTHRGLAQWTYDLTGDIMPSKSVPSLPPEGKVIFNNLRVSKYFSDYVGIPFEDITPQELVFDLGYQLNVADSGAKSLWNDKYTVFPYLRYRAGCIKRGHRARPLWHRWA